MSAEAKAGGLTEYIQHHLTHNAVPVGDATVEAESELPDPTTEKVQQ